jgi:hypothetical protein
MKFMSYWDKRRLKALEEYGFRYVKPKLFVKADERGFLYIDYRRPNKENSPAIYRLKHGKLVNNLQPDKALLVHIAKALYKLELERKNYKIAPKLKVNELLDFYSKEWKFKANVKDKIPETKSCQSCIMYEYHSYQLPERIITKRQKHWDAVLTKACNTCCPNEHSNHHDINEHKPNDEFVENLELKLRRIIDDNKER